MTRLQGARVRVIGAGVVGLCVALELRAQGAGVELIDENVGAAASAVAAGMIAPAFEAALEEPEQGRMALLRAARDLWPEVAGGAVRLHRHGALAVARAGEEAELARLAEALTGEGAVWERVTAAEAHRLCAFLAPDVTGGLFSPEDWRLDAQPALELLQATFQRAGGRARTGRIEGAELRTGADATVICAGWGSRALVEVAPELAALQPIRGQLARFPGAAPHDGPTLRSVAGGYLAPGAAGAVAGATMESGRDDVGVSPETHAILLNRAVMLAPHLARAPAIGAAGVRAATPDGLPLVGRSRAGPFLATGFRRNGWLLAPLAARITAELLAGRDPGPWAAALRPERFQR